MIYLFEEESFLFLTYFSLVAFFQELNGLNERIRVAERLLSAAENPYAHSGLRDQLCQRYAQRERLEERVKAAERERTQMRWACLMSSMLGKGSTTILGLMDAAAFKEELSMLLRYRVSLLCVHHLGLASSFPSAMPPPSTGTAV